MRGILRISFGFIMVTLLWDTVSHAQQVRRISMRAIHCRVEQVIDSISSLTDIGFIYDPEIMKGAPIITIEAKNMLIKDLLNMVLDKQGFQYKLTDRICLVYKANIQVKGKVITETGEPLAGATVEVNNGLFLVTDSVGKFTINGLSRGDMLSFYYVSHVPRHILYDGNTHMLVKLNLAVPEMEPVVQVHYTGYRKPLGLPTGSFMEVMNNTMDRLVGISFLDRMSAITGSLLVPSWGSWSSRKNQIQIRGQTSIGLVPGSLPYNAPLILIDGIPYAANYTSLQPAPRLNIMGARGPDPYVNININDIESINVLRSGEGTAFYGSSGANGVVVITSKRGKYYASPVWNVEASMGLGQIKLAPKLMNTQQYLAMRQDAFRNDNTTPTEVTAPDLVSWDTARNTDFRKKLLNTISHKYDLQASYSAGNKNTGYRLSMGYDKESTSMPLNIDFDRSTLGGHITQRFANGKLQVNGIILAAFSKNNAGIYDLAGYAYLPPNMLQTGSETYTIKTSSVHSGVDFQYRPLSSLEVSVKLGQNGIRDNEIVTLPVRWRSVFTTGDPLSDDYQIRRVYNSRFVQPLFRYEIYGNKNRYTLLLGATMQQITNRVENKVTALRWSDSVLHTTHNSHTEHSKYNYLSHFSHVDFNIKEKYMASITYRNDCSSLLRMNDHGNFGAIGGAWIFSNDSTFKRLFPFINYGKLRAGYAITGNDQYIADNYNYNSVFPSVALQGGAATVPVLETQRDYSWEISRKIDLGIELELFHNRISLDVGVYRNRTGNQITGYRDPARGLNAIKVINSPALVQNKGLEISLQLKNNHIGRLKWNSNLVLNIPNNKLLSFSGLATSPYANTLVPGKSLSVQQGYQYVGVNSTTGLFEMADLNKDGRIDRYHDFKVLGDLDPRLYGTMRLNLNYKNWRLDLALEGRLQKGLSMLSQLYGNIVPGASMVNLPVEFLDRWRKPGDQASIQRLSANNSPDTKTAIQQYVQSDARLVPASYLRLKYVDLCYVVNLKKKEYERSGKVSLYLSTDNLFTITKYKNADPQYQNIFTQPLQTSITAGARLSF